MNVLILFGGTLLLTFISSFICSKIKVPQVIGHIIIGLGLGLSGFKVYTAYTIDALSMLTFFVLSLIGFMIGGELRWARLKRFGRSILWITFFESFGSCLFVFFAIYFFTNNLPLSLLLGALACATAPGGTTNVIQEYKARGSLTSTLYGVVGADDALAIIIFSIFSGISKVLIGATTQIGIVDLIGHILYDLGGSICLGLFLGLIISFWMLIIRSSDARHLLTLIALFICSGCSIKFGMSPILSSMLMGIVIANIRPHRSRSCFNSLHYIASPLYMLFFVIIGAQLDFKVLSTMGITGIMYFIFRSLGKYFGAFTGAYLSNAPDKIRQNIGFCLLSQAGVAIGLATSMRIEFSNYNLEAQQLGSSIVTIITASTLIFQIVGPIMTKYALSNAKETHLGGNNV